MTQVSRQTNRATRTVATSDVPDGQRPSQIVVETVAATEGVLPTELDASLYDSIDPDALDSFARTSNGRARWRVAFDFAGYEVVVTGDRRVSLRERPAEP